jgi:hypothetical protein
MKKMINNMKNKVFKVGRSKISWVDIQNRIH